MAEQTVDLSETITLAAGNYKVTMPLAYTKLCVALTNLIGDSEFDSETPLVIPDLDEATLERVGKYLIHHWKEPFVTDRPGTGENPDEPEMPDPPIETFNPEHPDDWTIKDRYGNVWKKQNLAEHWAKPSPNRRTNLTEWDKKLMDLPFEDMVKFAKAARFLDHREMYRMALKCLAENDLKVLPSTEVTKENIEAHRRYYGIPNDFTPEEEEAAMKEDKWREYGPGDPRNHVDIN